jgi:hypothetical protein
VSMARIAALPYVYHWDMLSSEFYIVLPIIVLLIGVRSRLVHGFKQRHTTLARMRTGHAHARYRPSRSIRPPG